ncbi:hypothetical protein [Candidatus Hodarchaeum mangrovi]
MDETKWWELLKASVRSTIDELDVTRISAIGLFSSDNYFFPNETQLEPNVSKNLILLGRAWLFLSRILQNELQLSYWDSIAISGRSTTLSFFSLGFDIYLLVEHESTVDPLDIIKMVLKFVFKYGYQEEYETVGLVAAEGFPIWVSSIYDVDEFLFAISITSLLTLIERIDMEVNAGGVISCILQGTESLRLHVSFNPSQDIVLATTLSKHSSIVSEEIPEVKSLLGIIKDPALYPAFVPELKNEERERMLKEIRQDFNGEITEEEIESLTSFKEETLLSIEEEITSVARKYRANEISVGYLRKRMRLPSEVLSMSLEYLIATGKILGRIGRSTISGQEILVLDHFTQKQSIEIDRIKIVQSQITDLFLPLENIISQLPEITLEAQKQEIRDALSEYQIIQTLADSDPLYLLTNEIRTTNQQLENLVKGLIFLKKRLTKVKEQDILQTELNRRYTLLNDRIYALQIGIYGKVARYFDDLKNHYQLLLRLIPTPTSFPIDSNEAESNLILVEFRCQAHNCLHKGQIQDYYTTWIKLGVFARFLGIIEEFPDANNIKIIQLKNNLILLIENLEKMSNEVEVEKEVEFYPFLNDLDDLIISNNERERLISLLQGNALTEFFQCSTCNKWYCNKHIKENKCLYC